MYSSPTSTCSDLAVASRVRPPNGRTEPPALAGVEPGASHQMKKMSHRRASKLGELIARGMIGHEGVHVGRLVGSRRARDIPRDELRKTSHPVGASSMADAEGPTP
ncbi:MAG: hypothetical protein CMJ27_12105 [Phycisphaerae bacterium]|nr:hypothetical protein [Phycisphaerae bacterium]